MKGYRLELELVAPVHVGTGETYPAYAYVPDFRGKRVHLLDPARLLEELDSAHQERYLRAVESGPVEAQKLLQVWLEEGRIPQGSILRTLGASKAFLEVVRQAQEGVLEYRPLPSSPLGPYLPGSSVKGALRTAWIFRKVLEKKQDLVFDKQEWTWGKPHPARERPLIKGPKGPKPSQAFEGFVLGYSERRKNKTVPNFYRDPFRAVKVSDSGPLEGFLNLIRVYHPRKKMGISILAETLRKGTRITLAFRLEEGLAQYKRVSHPIPEEDLVQACRDYYREVMAVEREYAEKHGLKRVLEVHQALEEGLKDPKAFPLRFGFGAGGLAVHLTLLMDTPKPQTRKTTGAQNPQDGYPLGWALARLL